MTSSNDIQRELALLREENARLKRLLRKHGIAYEASTSPIVSAQKPMPRLSLEEKVMLFRGLFRGREDVFARHWYSPKTDKSGNQPACTREWNPAYYNKKNYKCAECPNREFQQLGYTDVYAHLEGNYRDQRVIPFSQIDRKIYINCTDLDAYLRRHRIG